MAHILRFRSNVARNDSDCEVTPESGAQIIIFPGVRRERHPDLPTGSRRRDKGRPKRDRLELPD